MPKKDIFYTNLVTLREQLGYTQNELAEILGVTPKMISNYETGIYILPIKKALLLSKKFNYSLDWIYNNCENNLDRIKLKNYPEEYCIKFLVDIRDFISCSDDKITLSIGNSYWDYIKKVNIIRHSKKTIQEKKIEVAELNGNYRGLDHNIISWEFSTDINNFISMIKINPYSPCSYASNDAGDSTPINDEQIKEVEDFINILMNTISE